MPGSEGLPSFGSLFPGYGAIIPGFGVIAKLSLALRLYLPEYTSFRKKILSHLHVRMQKIIYLFFETFE